jgi:hypothetical protein
MRASGAVENSYIEFPSNGIPSVQGILIPFESAYSIYGSRTSSFHRQRSASRGNHAFRRDVSAQVAYSTVDGRDGIHMERCAIL